MGSKKTPKYPELAMTYDEVFNTRPNWDVMNDFTQGIVDYCQAAGLIVDMIDAAENFIPECLQRLYMEWHGFGEFTRDSFTLAMLNGWMNEWRDLVENGNAPDGLLDNRRSYTVSEVIRRAKYAFMRVKNHDDRGSAAEFRKLVNDNVRGWVNEQVRKREEAKAHRAKLAQTARVRLRKSDIEFIINRVKECVEPFGDTDFKRRVEACLHGDENAALEGL